MIKSKYVKDRIKKAEYNRKNGIPDALNDLVDKTMEIWAGKKIFEAKHGSGELITEYIVTDVDCNDKTITIKEKENTYENTPKASAQVTQETSTHK